MSRTSEKRAEFRERSGKLRLAERRAKATGQSVDDLSLDPTFLQAKLHAKKKHIRDLNNLVARMKFALQQGWTWEQFCQQEGLRDYAREARFVAESEGRVSPDA